MPRLLPAPGPRRVLAVSNLVYTLGSGLYLTAGVLYFTEAAGIPPGRVGLGLALAGLLALGAGIVVGHLADRLGARGVYVVTLVAQAAATAGFLLADSFAAFVVAVSLAGGAKAAGIAARGPLIRAFGGERPQEFRAYLRAVTNVGISVGAVGAGWAVQVGSVGAYQLLVVANALALAGSAVVLVWLPPVPPAKTPLGGPRWIALRDRRYLLVTLLDGVMAVQFKVLTVALPLWLVGATSAPHWLVGASMVVGTVIVVAFQVRASRGIDTPRAGGKAYLKAGVAFLVACLIISAAAGVPGWIAGILIISGVVVHTVGELWHSAAGFEVSFALAPEHATGQYLGVFGLGAGLAEAFGPGALIVLCVEWGRAGWVVVGGMFAVTGMLAPRIVGGRKEGRGITREGARSGV
ncbi:MFS transporter [Streptomyces niveiscabiei]|uniref:MFS transporter n=1 Tax=Streptomyces niveiscabiei TaxID=164115 RepID=UPI0029B2B514|nr:MFS transporter [Streptomyces niveiscabiei]MDX3379846.1 MFS transporter [Streptomyces niveiscabiei]